MTTETKVRTQPRTELQLIHGCGVNYRIPGEKLAGAQGTTLDVLREIARREIRDPELVRTLADANLVVQVFEDEPGETHQRTVDPKSEFSDLGAILEEKNLEMAVSVAHRGGLVRTR